MSRTIKNVVITINKRKYNIIVQPSNIFQRCKNIINLDRLELITEVIDGITMTRKLVNADIKVYYNLENLNVTRVMCLKQYANNITIKDSNDKEYKMSDILNKMTILDINILRNGDYFNNATVMRSDQDRNLECVLLHTVKERFIHDNN